MFRETLTEMLSLSPSKIYEMAGKEIPCFKIGGAVRFDEEAIKTSLSSGVVEVKLEPQRKAALPHLRHVKL